MASLRNAGMSSAVFGEELDSGIIAIGFIGCGISFTIYQKNNFVNSCILKMMICGLAHIKKINRTN